MKEVAKRLLLAALMIPVLVVVVIYLPYANRIALLITVMLFTYAGAWEFLAISLKGEMKKGERLVAALGGPIVSVTV